ncbi:shikimate kinase [Clostridium tertium]|jgi:shikimate kinase|uniref:Shikimate kinase n=1 Tax=Clostridium tertium TaxID=1559 RepID=A0A9X4B0N9_9CLOT|nr:MULTISPECIES: shikimate kinase [Clostridium]MBS5886717.1 shikimate kinase [Clostridium sp.]MBU6134465.1 shikimate kinase [Clostridium tertium]MDB1923870.1 shikimate kinase [Clostridium tertium]MDB1924997.1 shikimate kinase [Clostridium tertium]MDB1929339.1 shikimate kinase [Clostridium tertium]
MDKNIILLIGMPGCGKSTIGEELANKINYDFCDMDKYIEEISNSTVKELFNISEEYFRDYETLACKELSNKSKIIISSGGGVIKRKKNIDFFKDKGIIIFIDRPIEDILKDVDTSSRPLLSDGKSKLYNLYSERYNLYNNYCEIKIVNDTTIEETIDKIIKII